MSSPPPGPPGGNDTWRRGGRGRRVAGASERGASLKIRFHGVRGSRPCSSPATMRYGGNTSSVAVEVDGAAPVLLDLGTGVAGRAVPAGTTAVTALVTHLHFDHIQGLPFLAPALPPGLRLEIVGPAQEGRSLADAFTGLVRPPYFPVPLDQLGVDVAFREATAEAFDAGGVRVTVRPVPHVGPTVGYRLEADGVVVCFVSDHQAPAGLDAVAASVLDLCRGADLLIHDAQYTPEEFAAKATWGHCTPGYAVRVAREAGVRRLCLYHHDPSHDDAEIDRLTALARKEAGDVLDVVAAPEGSTLTL